MSDLEVHANEIMDKLVNHFGEMKISLTNKSVNVGEAKVMLETTNRQFIELYETWDLLDPETQKVFRTAFMAAQNDFHYVANLLLISAVSTDKTADLNQTHDSYGKDHSGQQLTDNYG